jgi:hypothetical protein
MIQERLNKYQSLLKEFKNLLKTPIAERFLTKEEAPLYVGDKSLGKYLEKFFKEDRDIIKPSSYEDILTVIVSIIEKQIFLSPSLWNIIKSIRALKLCIEYPDDPETSLNSYHNTIALLNEDTFKEIDGKWPFYFKGRRSF